MQTCKQVFTWLQCGQTLTEVYMVNITAYKSKCDTNLHGNWITEISILEFRSSILQTSTTNQLSCCTDTRSCKLPLKKTQKI